MRCNSRRDYFYLLWATLRTRESFNSIFSGLMSLWVSPSLLSSTTVCNSYLARTHTSSILSGRLRESANWYKSSDIRSNTSANPTLSSVYYSLAGCSLVLGSLIYTIEGTSSLARPGICWTRLSTSNSSRHTCYSSNTLIAAGILLYLPLNTDD